MQLPNTIQIKNGEKVKPTFSAQEYANRQGKLRAAWRRIILTAAVALTNKTARVGWDLLSN